MEKPDSPESKSDKGKESAPPGAPGPYLSPKLREKIMAAESAGESEWKPKPPSRRPLIVTIVVVVVVAAGVFLVLRASNQAKHKAQAKARADSLAAAAAAESSLAAARRDSVRAAAAAESTAIAARKAAVEAAARAGGPFGIQAGTYLDEGRANREKERLGPSTGLAARVVPATEGGSTVYHVVLGSFDNRTKAEQKGLDLLGRNLVSQALVVPLRKK